MAQANLVMAAWRRKWSLTALGLMSVVMLATACAPSAQSGSSAAVAGSSDLKALSGRIEIDGSSTVFPISEAMAEEFQIATGNRVQVTVGVSGTGGGFKKFCAGETDISNASRPIKDSEIEACQQNNIEFIELPVAYDGLSVMVNPKNTFVDKLTVAELRKMWEPAAQGTVTRWSQIREGWPDEEFRLYGPGTDSGTFEYFTETVNGEAGASRGDYTASEDDNVLVQGISNDPNALGYFGYAYYEENQDRLKLVPIDDGKGNVVAPSEETIRNGTYQPLSRPIFIYARASSVSEKPQVKEFLRFYTNPEIAAELVSQVGYVAFPTEYYQRGWQRVESMKLGSVFAGAGAKEGLTLDEIFE